MPVCNWNTPRAFRYTGSWPEAIDRYLDIPQHVRSELKAMINGPAGGHTAIVTITRDGILEPRFKGLWNMQWGAGRLCQGVVDNAQWPADRRVEAIVYAVQGYAVGFASECSNPFRTTDTLYGKSASAVARAVVNEVPEPSTLWLLPLAGLAHVISRRARKVR